MKDTMTIEILYFEGCPNSGPALQRVREALESQHLCADVRMVEVRDQEDAAARRFLGSPTIQVDGQDVERDARSRRDYGFMCRTYPTPFGTSGMPSMQTIVSAIREI
jgi:hypothetical protein